MREEDRENRKERKEVWVNEAKCIATIASACVCGLLILATKGASGIGWFILALLIIW